MSITAPEVTPEALAPVDQEPRALYKFSLWTHAGHGAEDCSEVDENAGTCQCSDTGHFHAWCRLPNELQRKDIRERALAAKARRTRQLRNQGTDGNEILETALEDLIAQPDARDLMVNEILGYAWAHDYLNAMREARDLDDEGEGAEEGAKLFEHIEDDQARYQRLSAQDSTERNEDEFEELQQHLGAYQAAVNERFEAAQAPQRASLEQADESDLLDRVRRKRIEAAGQEEFMHHYSIHSWLSCTYRQRAGTLVPYFRDLAHMQVAEPEVLIVLQTTFADLERTAQEALGN